MLWMIVCLILWKSNDMRMIRWMSNVTLKDRKPSKELRGRCGLESVRESLQRRRLRWFGHVERMSEIMLLMVNVEKVDHG